MSAVLKPSAVEPPSPRRLGTGRMYALAVLALIGLLNTIDQSILAVTSPAIQSDFKLTDAQVGLLSAAFIVVYAMTALPSGLCADRFRRRSIIALGVAAWSVCTLLTGIAQSYVQLLAARAALGIGESTTLPAGVSLVGDHFGRVQRGRAAGVLQGALQVGLALGLIVGGLLAARFGWRSVFFAAAAPGLVLALLASNIAEPRRGEADADGCDIQAGAAAATNGIASLFRIRGFVSAAIANSLLVFATTGIGVFVPIHLSRSFGLDLGGIGLLVGMPLLVSGLFGNVLGGWLVDWRARRSARGQLEVPTLFTFLAGVAVVATFSATTPAAFVVSFVLATLAGNIAMPGLLAVNQNLILPRLRGRATAIQQLWGNLFGRAFGVLLIGLLADAAHDLRLTLVIVPSTALLLAAIAAASGLASLPRGANSRLVAERPTSTAS